MSETSGWETLPLLLFSDYEWNEALGAVRSWKRRNGRGRMPASPRVLKADKGSVYKRWGLYNDVGHKCPVSLHLLVCSKHHGPRPAGMEVCHNDGNPNNNSPENLRWDTHSANVMDAIKHGTHVNNRGERCGTSKLSSEEVFHIRASTGQSGVYLAKRFGVSKSRISEIRSGKTWRHLLEEARSDNRV